MSNRIDYHTQSAKRYDMERNTICIVGDAGTVCLVEYDVIRWYGYEYSHEVMRSYLIVVICDIFVLCV